MTFNNAINQGRGTAGEVLTSNGAALDPTFQAAGGGSPYPQPDINTSSTDFLLGYVQMDASTTSLAVVDSDLYLFPIMFSEDVTITSFATKVGSSVAGSSVRLGIYNNSNNTPTTILSDGGIVSTATGGVKEITGLSISLSANTLYWGASVADENAGSLTMTIGGNEYIYSYLSSGLGRTGYKKTGVSAGSALPSPLTGLDDGYSKNFRFWFGVD